MAVDQSQGEDEQLPLAYRWLKAHHFEGLTPWYFVEPAGMDEINKEYNRETGKSLLTFARRQDNDDVAGFEIIDGKATSAVITVHLTWTGKREQPGFPLSRQSEDIFTWLTEVVIPETQDWATEEELRELAKDE